jgi:outer membrane protein assembly factor BamD (BamD/ComL family)
MNAASFLGPRLQMALLGCMAALVIAVTGGCASLTKSSWPWNSGSDVAADLAEEDSSSVISSEYAGAEEEFGWNALKGETLKRRFKKLVGRGPNESVAKQALNEADDLFQQKEYAKALKHYRKVIDRWPDSALEEDALWQSAECLFFTDQYPKAEDEYDGLVKKYPNTRYLDRIAQRQFVIAQYWLALDGKRHLPLLVPNVIDRSRPLFDTRGRALKAYEHVRLNDPRGPLADDSLMAEANAHFLNREWLDADYFYSLLRTEYPDSEFLMPAHLFALQAKLKAYQGPTYEGGMLDEAEILADQILVQFPDQLSTEEEQRVVRSRAEIAAQQALRHWKRAEFYKKGNHYTSARIYYALIARDYPKTMLAQQSRDRLEELAGLEDVSDDPFPALTAFLNPDSLKEAELDAMAEAETAIARQDNSGESPPLR